MDRFCLLDGTPRRMRSGAEILMQGSHGISAGEIWKAAENESKDTALALDRLAFNSALNYLEQSVKDVNHPINSLDFISINLNRYTIEEFPPWMSTILLRFDRFNLPQNPSLMKYIEINEATAPSATSNIKNLIQYARSCRIMIDDVGEKKAFLLLSASTYKHVLKYAKLDVLIWREIAENPDLWNSIYKYIEDGMNTGFSWIIEGIESPSDLDILAIILKKCPYENEPVYVQGYGIGFYD